MFEFRWTLSGTARTHEVRLRIHARNGWIGRKFLDLDDAPLYRRRWFGGINHAFAHPTDPHRRLRLRAVRDPATGLWYPQLTDQDQIVAETTGCAPPPIPDRTKSVAIVTGVAYLTMLMAVVMWGHIWKMLEAARGHSDSRAYVFAVLTGEPTPGPHLQRSPLPRATPGQPYEATVGVDGGEPPYRWVHTSGKLPRGLSFDDAAGRLHGTPIEPGEAVVTLRAIDAQGATAEWSYVLSVDGGKTAGIRIVTESLPDIAELESFSAVIEATGGRAPYEWVFNDRKLPHGILRVKPPAGAEATARLELRGPPAPNFTGLVRQVNPADRRIVFADRVVEVGDTTVLLVEGRSVALEELEPGDHLSVTGVEDRAVPIRFRVFDSSYSPYRDLAPWMLPLVATAVCLLGFWNMRRGSVILYALLIVGQVVLPRAIAEFPLRASPAAVVLQVFILIVGLASYRRMT